MFCTKVAFTPVRITKQKPKQISLLSLNVQRYSLAATTSDAHRLSRVYCGGQLTHSKADLKRRLIRRRLTSTASARKIHSIRVQAKIADRNPRCELVKEKAVSEGRNQQAEDQAQWRSQRLWGSLPFLTSPSRARKHCRRNYPSGSIPRVLHELLL